jgi:hypothetical protein
MIKALLRNNAQDYGTLVLIFLEDDTQSVKFYTIIKVQMTY